MTSPPPGYDPAFLLSPAPLPLVPEPARIRTLDYTHFTVLLDSERRLAAATAVNIDGSDLVDVARGDDWHLDPRVPAEEQAGPELYARNDLDRGHLVRRRDPVWGEDALEANLDTFVYTNAAPQASEFNQSKELWNGLEDHVLDYAAAHRLRLCVLTGPVLADDDPLYRGIRIPRLYWKVAAWHDTDDDALAAVGFVLDQTPVLGPLESARAAEAEPTAVPPLGPFRTFEVPIADVEELTALDLGAIAEADRFPEPDEGEQVLPPLDRRTWRPLLRPTDVRVSYPAGPGGRPRSGPIRARRGRRSRGRPS